jgi:ankyrin repeat protein
VNDDRILLETITDHPMGNQPAGTSLMHAAALSKNADLVRALLARGLKPDHQNADGNTPLHIAAANMPSNAHRLFEEVATELINAGAQINVENNAGDTPVHLLRSLQQTTSKSQENTGPHKSMEDLLAVLANDPNFDAAKACRPGNMSQLLAACYHGDTAEITKLNPNDPILNQRFRGITPLHAAAEGGHLDTVQALVDQGADVNAKAPRDRNALHVLCASGIDNGPLASYLINQMGAESSARDEDGRTPLMLAAENGLSQAAKEMLSSPHRVFFNAADKTGMTPHMYAVMKSDVGGGSCEQEFYQAFPELDEGGPGKSVSTVDMLMWMTNVDDREEITDETLRSIYQDLYDDPTLRPVLEIAARDGAGRRSTDGNRFGGSALRINASNGHGPAGGGGQGNYMPDGNRLNFGAKQNVNNAQGKGFWLDSVKGTLIHELTHHAAAITYDNYGLPVPKGTGANGNDTDAEQAYLSAFEEDVRSNSHLAITADEHRVVTLVSSRLQPYQKKLMVSGKELSGGENMQLELIVGISQAIAELGLPLVKKLYPNLTKHYQETFANDIQERCRNNDLSAPDLDMDLDVQKKPTADGPDKQFSPTAEIDSEAVWKMVVAEFTFAKKQMNPQFATVANDGVPIWNVTCLELDPTDTKLLSDLKPFITKLLEKEMKTSDLPPQLSTERVRELVRAVSGECLTVDPNNSLKDEAGKIVGNLKQAATTFKANATQDFDDDYLSSTRQRLARLTSKDYTLTPRSIAELTVIRASDLASLASIGNEALSVNPQKLAQIVDYLESKITEQMKLDSNFQIDAEKYVNQYADLLVQDKTFFLKKKGKTTGRVSTKVSSVKSLWKKKLRKIKV